MSDPVDDLKAADEAYREAESALRERGEEEVERVADALERATDLLDRYEEPASGSGRETFEAYVEFEERVVNFVEGLPDDLPRREAFERMSEVVDKRRLSEDDFERAREALGPAREVAALIEERDAAGERYRAARAAVEARLREVEGRIDELESLVAFGDVDLDAPVDGIREPIDAYDRAVREAFDRFRRETSAREVVAFVDTATAYPLVDFRPPPDDLRSYLDGPPGGEPIPTLLEWAGYSRSKLEHYVDDPGRFRAAVSGSRTYLERLDASPLEVGWPPPPADELRWRARELVAVVDRFAPEDVVSKLHQVRDLADDADYGRLRRAAVAREELDGEKRERLASGEAERELERLRDERDRLREALSGYPER